MANVVRDIKARIGAARAVLESPAISAAASVSISKVQTSAIVAAIEAAATGGSLQPEDCAELCQFATTAEWQQTDLERILQALAMVSVPPCRKRRRAQQNFTAVMEYFTEADWKSLATSTSKDGVLLAIIRRAWQVGLRTPSEPTLKAMNSAWAVLTEAEAACLKFEQCAFLHVFIELTLRSQHTSGHHRFCLEGVPIAAHKRAPPLLLRSRWVASSCKVVRSI